MFVSIIVQIMSYIQWASSVELLDVEEWLCVFSRKIREYADRL